MIINNHEVVPRSPSGRLSVLLLGHTPPADGMVDTVSELTGDLAVLIEAARAGEHDLTEINEDIRTVDGLWQMLKAAMAEVESNEIDLVVIGELPTLNRDTSRLLWLISACRHNGARCMMPSMQIDTATEAGQFQAQIMLMLNWESTSPIYRARVARRRAAAD